MTTEEHIIIYPSLLRCIVDSMVLYVLHTRTTTVSRISWCTFVACYSPHCIQIVPAMLHASVQEFLGVLHWIEASGMCWGAGYVGA